jgi:hypothetical protein
MTAPEFRVVAIELYERPVALRIPFRFGAATVTHAPQAFVRARILLGAGREALGAAAELMIPKWFDKSPQKSNADNVDDLRRSLSFAAAAYLAETRALNAFGHFAAHYAALIAGGAGAGLNPLTSNYGPALIDRAILDALCRTLGISLSAAIRVNLPGINTSLTPDLAGFSIDRFVAGLTPRSTIAARHTVGMLDPIVAGDAAARVGDGLPETLEEVIAAYGNRHFKLKLGGDPHVDVERLLCVAAVLDRLPGYAVTLDGNEQYADPLGIAELWRRIEAMPPLARLFAQTLYLEQPLPRAIALDSGVSDLATCKPLLIDESDATLDAFPAARLAGYTGVSSKSCKGIYKSLLNAARCAHWNDDAAPRYFLSGEDLTTQVGLALQQDLALAALLGLQHVERNGHHYVNGFAGQTAGDAEQRAFLAAQPGLYEERHGSVRLAIRDGVIDISSLDAPGFASAAQPDWVTLEPLGAALAAAT